VCAMSTEPDTASLRPPPAPKRVRFAELGGPAMAALLDGDLPAASRITGVPLTGYFLTDRARWLWRYRLDQMAAEPGEARWMVRQAVLGDGGEVVGHAGFHGPPDADTMPIIDTPGVLGCAVKQIQRSSGENRP
jgi:[ribosomal protein S5]-alanine N-acetyltransferase